MPVTSSSVCASFGFAAGSHALRIFAAIFSTFPPLSFADASIVAAAGIVASWFGSLASYKGATFPVSFDTVPIGNAAMEKRTFIEWDKDDIDALKLMKVDILALGMLSALRKSFALLPPLADGTAVTDVAHIPQDREKHGFVLYDQGSSNGTRVNGEHTQLRIVRPGGVVAIGINAAHFAAAGFGEAFEHLVSRAHVVVGGLRPGALAGLGLDRKSVV